jgi:CRP-like cAMP-binding protein
MNIANTLRTPPEERSTLQVTTLAKWIMTVWDVAKSMGFKRCVDMSQALGIQTFNEGEHIVSEGERGLTFYIIISGSAVVHKQELGDVGSLSKGMTFGELALTQGKDVRTASIIAVTECVQPECW